MMIRLLERSWKRLLLTPRLMRPSLWSKRVGNGHLVLFLMAALVTSGTAMAGGAMTGGATELTQIMNNMQLSLQYIKQIQQYSTQLQQYQAQLQNLARAPTSALGAEVPKLLQGVGGIMSAGQSIGNTMAQVDQTFSQKFQNPLAGNYSQNFKTWTTTSQDTLGSAMRAAGMHRDGFSSDSAALTALYNQSQSTDGTVAAVQKLSALVAMQIQQNQKLLDLISSQNLAAGSYMAGINAKDQAAHSTNDEIQNGFTASKPPIASLSTSNQTYKKWDLYTPK